MPKKLTSLVLIGTLILCSCNGSKSAVGSNNNTTNNTIYVSLADYLRRNSSVNVQGVHPDIRLRIRGVNSISADTRPYIYVDKTPIGRDYAKASNYVNPNDIKRVVVLSSLADLTTYGQEGHSGVIRIYTNSGGTN